MRSIGTAGLVAALLLAGTGLCAAQTFAPPPYAPPPYAEQGYGEPGYGELGHAARNPASPSYGPEQPPPRSRYADGTGNVAMDALNAGQLDQNYRGPWYPAAPGRMQPGAGLQAYPAPYGQPVYPLPGD